MCNILAQNPRFGVTTTSGIFEVILSVRNQWNQIAEFKATPNPEGLKRVLKGIFQSYHKSDKEVVFDKCRGWVGQLELAEEVIDNDLKVLVPVRDMKQVVSSWEKLHRKQLKNNLPEYYKTDPLKAQTVRGRAEICMSPAHPVGSAHNRILDGLDKGFSKNMFCIDYDDLTNNPKEVMKMIYEFLEEPYFEHDFDNVKQVTESNDLIFGFQDLHKIRPKVEPQEKDWKEVLGDWAIELDKYNFWIKNNKQINGDN